MKKVFFLIVAMFAACTCMAQDDLDFTDANPDNYLDAKRMHKIEKVMNQKAADTGDASVDEFINSSILGAKATVASNIKLREMYKREIGATDEDGVTDVTVAKPTLEDWVELGTELAAQANAAAQAGMKVKEVTENAKKLGGMTGVKAAKEVAGSANNWKVIGEETACQIKAVDAIIKVLKSAKNN